MPLDQAAIHDALFERLLSEVKVKFATRDWIEPSALKSVGRQPALEYSVEGYHNINAEGLPPKIVMTAEVILYVLLENKGQREAGDTLLDLTRQVEAALLPHRGENAWVNGGFRTTLGDLVQRAWVTKVEIGEGHVTGQAAAIVTIEMLAAEG